MLKLDFSIFTSEDRNKAVTKFFNENPNYKPTQKELDTISNYILYGKDEATNSSVVDRKEVQIETKYNSYSRKRPESLDSLIETPGFDEQIIQNKIRYSNRKQPKIDREKDADIPGMRELWKSIDRVKEIIEFNTKGKGNDKGNGVSSSDAIAATNTSTMGSDKPDAIAATKLDTKSNVSNDGSAATKSDINSSNNDSVGQSSGEPKVDSIEPEVEPKTYPILSKTDLYNYKHNLIELRTQQYYLRDIFKPTEHRYGIIAKKPPLFELDQIDWEEYGFFPLGLYNGDLRRFETPLKFPYDKKSQYDLSFSYLAAKEEFAQKNAKFIDFTNADHIYWLLEFYDDLVTYGLKNPENISNEIVSTINFYVKKADLSDIRKDIMRLKVRGAPNKFIQEYVNKKYDKNYNVNYISTIYKQKICRDIADAARLNYEYFINRWNVFAFKKCNKCGEMKLIDSREFTKKKRSADGFENRCKKCMKRDKGGISNK